MASVNNNTIVVVNSVGPIIMDAWIENPNGTLPLAFRHDWPPYDFLALVTAVVRAQSLLCNIALLLKLVNSPDLGRASWTRGWKRYHRYPLW